MKRSSQEIKQKILQVLKDGKPYSYAELERKVNTGYRSIVLNCKELEVFRAVTINKISRHEANGKPYFQVSITSEGRDILKKL